MTDTTAPYPFSPLRRALGAVFTFLTLVMVATGAMAQNPFSPAVRVNDDVVTHYEIEQRMLFLDVVRTPGDLREAAIEGLVNERLQAQMAARIDAVATPDQIEAGLVEFAGRANLGAERFLQVMAEEGVAPETIRDFVANGISWRNVVQRAFAGRAQIDDTEVAEGIAYGTDRSRAQILLSEIVVPLTPQNEATLREEIGRLADDLNFDTETFAEAARRFSVASTRENGGLTGWRPFTSVPPPLLDMLLELRPGETSEPVMLGPAIAIFQLRGVRELGLQSRPVNAVTYATIPLAGGRTEAGLAAAADLRADIDVCDDLYGQRPGDAFQIQTQAVRDIPQDIAMVLGTLDNGEMNFDVTRQAGSVLLGVMLCSRDFGEPEGGIEAVRGRLFGQQLESYAQGLLAELRADAIIDYTP